MIIIITLEHCARVLISPPPNKTKKQACPLGHVWSDLMHDCAPCGAGTHRGADMTACAACPAGTWAAAGSPGCNACAPGSYAPDAESYTVCWCCYVRLNAVEATGAHLCTKLTHPLYTHTP